MDKEDLKYIEQGLLVCGINDDLGEKLLNEKFANNIDKDILNIIKDPKSETNFSKCSKSAAIRLVIAYNNPKYKDIKLCLGYFSTKGDEGVNNINHAWVEIDGKTYESNVPSGDYKRVLVDELTIDRNEDLYNQVEEFLNKTNLQENYVLDEKAKKYKYFALSDYDSSYYKTKAEALKDLINFGKDVEVRLYTLKNVDDIDELTSEDELGHYINGKLIKESINEDLLQETDSEGNPLTKEQVEFFKDSKVRDNQGRLLVCYHSTNNDFNEFKYATFFTPNKQFSLGYGNKTKVCYLNLEKPFVVDYDKLWDFVETHNNGDDYFENELDIVNEFGINTPDLYFTLLDAYDFSNDTSYYDLIDVVQGEGDFDGIILYNSMMNAGIDTQIIAFYPNQIKSIDNKNPSSSNNINEELDDNHTIEDKGDYILHTFKTDFSEQYVFEYKTLKGIMQVIMDNFINNKDYMTDDMTLYIEYKDGSTYYLGGSFDDGKFKRTGIKNVIIDDGTYSVYGDWIPRIDGALYIETPFTNKGNLQEDLDTSTKINNARQERKQAYDDLMNGDSTKIHRYKEWTIGSNNDYKEYIYNDLKKNKDKTLKFWYNDYKLKSGDYDLSYEDFLNKPFTLYRATNVNEKEDTSNPFFSYAQNKRTAERFLSSVFALDNGRTSEIEEITITPNKTFGMIPSDENEIIVPNKSYVNKVDNINSVVNELVDYANSKGVKLPYDRDELVDMFKKDRNIDKFKKLIIDYIDKRTITETINEEVLYHGQDDDDMYDRENTLTWYTTSEKYAKEYGQKIFTKDIDLSKYNLLDIGDINDEVFDNDGKYTKEFKQFCKKIEMTPKQLENYLKQFGWYPKYINFIFDITSEYPFYRLLLDLGYDGVKAKESGYDTYGLIKSDLNEGTSGQSIKQSNLNQKTKRNIIKIAKDNNFDFALDIKELSVHHLNDEKDDNGLKNNDYNNLVFIRSNDFRDREVLHKLLHYMDRNDISYDDLLNQLETIKLYKYDEPTNKFIVKTLSSIKESLLQETQKLYNIKEYYHGTPSKELDEEINSTLWFTDDIIYAMRYGENIFTCDLSVNNPLNVGDTNKYIRGLMPNTFSQEFIDIAKALNVEPKKLLHIDEDARKIYTIVRTKEFKDLCIKNGYDAIQTIEDGSMCYGIFDLNQIKVNDIDLG